MSAKSVEWYEIDGIKYKQCSDCLEFKKACPEIFSRKKTGFLGLRSICKECEHKRYVKNKDLRLKQSKERYNKQKEKILLQVKEYYKDHRDSKISYAKKYREDNKAIIKDKDFKRYWEKNYGLSSKEEVEKYKKDKYEKRLSNRPKENRSTFHWRTTDYIKKYNLRPCKCSICGSIGDIVAHHPDYSKWNEVVFCCVKCHNNIHAGNIECPNPIDILQLIKK